MADDLDEVLAGPVLAAAPRLLGATIRHAGVGIRITEVEAYDGANDPGSHAWKGPTNRNRVMFGPPGFLYVYLIYGMHHCVNVVCGPEGYASGVLIRAGEVVEGRPLVRKKRPNGPDRDLARGPARLCSALGFDRSHGGLRLGGLVTLDLGEPLDPGAIATGPRVGLRRAAENPWRFWIAGDETVSRYVAAKPRTGAKRPAADR